MDVRIGNLSDVMKGIDSLPNTNVLDKTIHGHGEALIAFMQEGKLCSLNSRLSPENNNFTCISPKALSIVDYIIVPHDVFHKCKAVDMCNLEFYIGNRCKLHDHSLLHELLHLTSYHLIMITLNIKIIYMKILMMIIVMRIRVIDIILTMSPNVLCPVIAGKMA